MVTIKGDGTVIHHSLVEQWDKEKPYRFLSLRKLLNKHLNAHLPTQRIAHYKEWDDKSSCYSESISGYGEY